MNNYQHHEKTQQLAEAHSAYELARRVVELESARGEAIGYIDESPDGGGAFVELYDGSFTLGSPVYLSPPAPAAVPEGWKLVPVDPSLEMVVAGGGAIDMNGGEGGDDEMQFDAIHAYCAMLAAAPAPAEPPQQAQREQTIPEGYALVEKSIVPELAVKTGASLLAHLQAQGHDYRTLALAVYTDMVLAANVGEYPEPPAPAAVPGQTGLGMFCTVARTELKEKCPEVSDDTLAYLNHAIKRAYELGAIPTPAESQPKEAGE